MLMNPSDIETVYIIDEIRKCEDIDDLKEKIFPMIKSQREQWIYKINEIISSNGYTKTKFAELCGVSRVTVDKWCKGAIPKNRETFLKIGLAARYDKNRMNQLLQRYGKYPALYSKSLEDCICIYLIEKKSDEDMINKYKYIVDRIKEKISSEDIDPVDNLTTAKFDAKLSAVQDEDELEQFIRDNIAMFSYTYYRFCASIKNNIEVNLNGLGTVSELALAQNWSSSLRQCVSAIYQMKWYPTRNKIISLGLHLSMDIDQINDMFMLAHMEPLCAKNIFESVVIYILETAELMIENIEETDAIFEYAREVMENLDIPEVESFIREISEIEDD